MKVVATTSQRLQELMQMHGITQADICRKSTLPKSSISRYVSGQRELGLDNAKLIATAFNINPAWLMGFDVGIKPLESNSVMKSYLPNSERGHIMLELENITDEMTDAKINELLRYAKYLLEEGD